MTFNEKGKMLVITRKIGQTIIIGDVLRIILLRNKGRSIELGLEDRLKGVRLQNILVGLNNHVQICDGIHIWFLTKKSQQIQIGIDASPNIKVMRGELYEGRFNG